MVSAVDYELQLAEQFATIIEPDAFFEETVKPLDDRSAAFGKTQRQFEADVEFFKVVAKFDTYQTVGSENHGFNASLVKDYMPHQTSETYRDAALLNHDRHYGVKHYLPSPSSKFSFAQYPSIDETLSIRNHLIPLPAKYSFESAIFGWDKDDAPLFDPPARDYVPPNPWALPIVDAPPTICPSLLQSNWKPSPVKYNTRPTIRLPSRAQQKPTPLPSSTFPQSASDYSAVLTDENKRKALNPPAPRDAKKATPTTPVKAYASCRGCPQRFDSKESLQLHQQLYRHDRNRILCTGCPAQFPQTENLRAHLARNAGCTSEGAARRRQAFYHSPKILALIRGGATQKDVMAFWRHYLQYIRMAT
ncbi:hypothetical protein C8R44DRAFT_877888 [Mycena epipterygia]|nr:hypothetical protein C8R44DRAFT_877888 [Mycena epipterygia]